MKIAVLIKQVPDSQAVRLDPATGTLIRNTSEAVTNPLDLCALAAALRLKREIPNSSITVLSMGPAGVERTLRESLALGADRAILICDRLCAGSDTLVTSLILAAALKKFGPFDLVLTGLRATDGETGQVGPETAARLGWIPVTGVESLAYSDSNLLTAKRLTETRLEEILFQTPAVVSVTKGIGDPGLATLERKKRARREPIMTVTAADLGLSPNEVGLSASPTRVVKIGHPVLSRKGRQITVSDDTSLSAAIQALTEFIQSGEGEK